VIVKRFFDQKLAQTSYLIGCGRKGVAIVVDPNRDIAKYVEMAAAEKVRIAHVTETHIHADFLSGARDLARATGAQLHLSDEGDAAWKYAYAASDGAHLVRDGDTIMVGNVRVTVVHTPGHTPEHISFLVTDTAAADEPIGICTGDFVFVGDVGRPDLLERAAKVAGTMEASARTLYRSLEKFKQYPDWLQVWPGHGAGSACGKGLSSVPHSTVGYEKRFNWAFSVANENAFVAAVLEGQPEPPKYFAMMKKLNKEGPAPFDAAREPRAATLADVQAALTAGTPVMDTRRTADFAAAHVPGTFNVPRSQSFVSYAGWFVPYDRDLMLITTDDAATRDAVADLALIGVDRVAAAAPASIIDQLRAQGGAVGSIEQLSPAEASARVASGAGAIVDVRGRSEWEGERIEGTPNVIYGQIADRLAELPKASTIILQCESGSRSAIAASVLASRGVTNVAQLVGGITAWEAAGLPVEHPLPATSVA
jgi:hydroxyacylglutathione hydrolase